MIKFDGFNITNKLSTFVEETTIFKNLQDLAEEHRNTFIAIANEKARQFN